MASPTQTTAPALDPAAVAGAARGTLLRLATAGSVDDGKSTLVGRLLHDTKSVLSDQLAAVERVSRDRGLTAADLALLTDGLRAEREQGITIDVAYRYFSTGARSFVLADCPGHVQYTRNMVTGATTADAVVVLVDGRKGVLEQTRRHLAVVALLRVPHVIVAVNKIDLVGYSEEIFADVAAQARSVATELGILDLHVLPVSALEGDNIVDRSARTPWYDGPALLELLETLPAADEVEQALEPLRLPVQLVLRPQGGLAPELAADPIEAERLRDYRAVAGRISSGTVSVGDRVEIFPSGIATTVTGIRSAGTPVETAVAPESVSLEFADDLDTARGAVVVAAGTLPAGRKEVDAELFQLDARTLTAGSRVLVKHGTTTVQAIVSEIESRYDLDSLTHEPAAALATNDIGRVRLRLAAELPLEPYSSSRHGGSFLVIHPSDGATLSAGIARN